MDQVSRTTTVARNSLWMTLDALISLPVSMALSILTARSIGPELLGVYNFATWILITGIAVGTSGLTYGMQQFAAERLGQGDLAGAIAVLRRGRKWLLVALVVIVCSGLSATIAFSPPEFRTALFLAVLSTAPGLMVSVPAAGLGAAQEYGHNVKSSIVSILVNLVAASLALAAGWNLVGLTLSLLLSRTVDVVLRHISWRHVAARLELDMRPLASPQSNTADIRKLERYAWKSSILLLFDLIVWERSEFIVLTSFSSLRELAFYSLSFNIVQQALMVPKMFAAGITANLLVERGRDQQNAIRLSSDSMRYVFLVAAPMTLGLAALGRAVMPLLYGPKYLEAIPVVAIVAGLAVMRGALVPVQDLLRMTEQQNFMIKFSVVMGAVNIGLDLWLIPARGAVGAAWANGIAQGVAMMGMTFFASQKLRLAVPLADMLRIVAACLPMVLVVSTLVATMPHWAAVLIAIPIGATSYLLALKLLRVLSSQDRDRLSMLGRALPGVARTSYDRAVSWLVASEVKS